MLKRAFAALSLICAFAACQNEDANQGLKPRKDINLTRAEQEMTNLGTDFAFRFFNQVCRTEKENPNLFVSPLSASLCLSMITNGATANTQDEMKAALGFSGYTVEEMNAYNRKMVSALLDLDNTTQLGFANSIWIKEGLDVYDDFIDVNRTMYDAQVKNLDFSRSDAKEVINQWCAEKTNNSIKKVVTDISDNTCMLLLNALYFKGIWKEKFNKSATARDLFTNLDGNKAQVSMMNIGAEQFNYAENEYFSIAELPYGNEVFSMVVLLPAENKLLDDCLAQLTAEHWLMWNDELASATLNLKLPRFELTYNKDLLDDMKTMGVNDAFNSDAANFSKISADNLSLGLLRQCTYLKVNEEGTEAAAVTVGGMDTAAPGPGVIVPFHVNRPFIFLIKEKSTGAILFMGRVTKL